MLNMTMQVVKEVLTDTSDAAAPAAFMQLMSWLAPQFAHLVKPTRQASLGEQSQKHQQQQQSSMSATAAVPLSADFYFFATLLQPLLSHLQHLDAVSNGNGAGVEVQMEETGAHVEASGSHTAASKSRKQGKGNKKEVKKTNGAPVAWHIAAEGAALLVWDNTLIFYLHNFLFELYQATQDPHKIQCWHPAMSLRQCASVCDDCQSCLPLSHVFPVSFGALWKLHWRVDTLTRLSKL